MKKTFTLVFLLLLLPLLTELKAQELRGTWLARTSFTSKAKLASQMDSLAAANFNVVYVNVWSRGYPLWQSEVFKKHTGVAIDPTYAGRDILAEAIAEGHRVGLHVEAWFEYGFVAGYAPSGVTSKGPIFEAHPDWVARTRAGIEKDGSNFYWMVQSHPEAQQFLISLATEIIRKYDVDGIEMDRIRYSSKEYGYDAYTTQLYKSEHNGAEPPQDPNDAGWMRWRADKINQFVALLYDSVKSVNPKVNVSSAPSQMGTTTYTAYENLLQDWKWWITNNKVDNLQMQSYSSSLTTYRNWNTYTKNSVSNFERIYPSFAVKPNTTTLTGPQIVEYLDVNTSLGFKGAALWFYDDLVGNFHYLRKTRFASPVHPPYATADWREHRAITTVDNLSDAVRTGTWAASGFDGYKGKSIYGGSGGRVSLDYHLNVPADAFYEVYVYTIPASNRSAQAEYEVYDFREMKTSVPVNQTLVQNSGWVKLGDYYLTQGRKRVIKLVDDNLEAGKFLSADAVMIVRNRRLDDSPVPAPLGVKEEDGGKRLLRIYPNPASKILSLQLPGSTGLVYSIKVVSLQGVTVYQINRPLFRAGQIVQIDVTGFPFGVYQVVVEQSDGLSTAKLVVQ